MTPTTAGERLRTRIAEEYERRGCEPDGREAEFIDRACATADAIAALDEVLAREGLTTAGSRGQTVMHPALAERRQHELVLLRLLSSVDFGPDADTGAHRSDAASQRARLAAQARWSRSTRRKAVDG